MTTCAQCHHTIDWHENTSGRCWWRRHGQDQSIVAECGCEAFTEATDP